MPPRILTVDDREAGWTVLDWLRARLRLPASAARRLLQGRKVRIAGQPCSNPAWRLRAGQRVEVQAPERKAGHGPHSRSGHGVTGPHSGPRAVIRFADEHIVVVDKPAGLTTMRHAEEAAEFGPR